jgi:hypothetical protein
MSAVVGSDSVSLRCDDGKIETNPAAGELVIVKQGDVGIEIASQMGCGMMLVVSAAVAVDVATFEHMWEGVANRQVKYLWVSPMSGWDVKS